MAELLIEIYSEEIPARMQHKAAVSFGEMLIKEFSAAGLKFVDVKTYVTPQRLVAVGQLPLQTQAQSEERRGPKATAPEQAIAGFLRSVGLTREQCEERGGYLFVDLKQAAVSATDVIPEVIRRVIKNFHWPKSMKWAQSSLSWVRPLRGILCILDGKAVSFELEPGGVRASNQTMGHRFMAPEQLTIASFEDYQAKLAQHYVELDQNKRRESIKSQLEAAAKQRSIKLIDDAGLLEEVTGLAEYPSAFIGEIAQKYMELPQVVLITAMRVHQKYFAFQQADGNLAPYFGVVSNARPVDGGILMMQGYARVLEARLSDALFFYRQDMNQSLQDLVPKLSNIIFHDKLGTVMQKCQRVEQLSEEPLVQRAAKIYKADLVTSMVYEFPELQGQMGEIYAKAQREVDDVALAIKEHYQPQGPSDAVPRSKVSRELALLDKVDTICGFFAMDQAPTGSKDPYALRRAALGIIRIILENELSEYDIVPVIQKSLQLYGDQGVSVAAAAESKIMEFLADRLIVLLKSDGVRYDCVYAVIATQGNAVKGGFNIWSIAERAKALQGFLNTEDGDSLLSAYRRAAGILKDAEKSNHKGFSGNYQLESLTEIQEKVLAEKLSEVANAAQPYLSKHQYVAVMGELAKLRRPVDAFFELTINDENQQVRENRLELLASLKKQTMAIADLSKIEAA